MTIAKARMLGDLALMSFCAAALLASSPAFANDAPRSYVASPEVYKVVAEGQGLHMVVATWPPGKRDNWHSHAASVFYWLTDCVAKIYTPDGKTTDVNVKAGLAGVQPAIP